jgi:hypothetical protein
MVTWLRKIWLNLDRLKSKGFLPKLKARDSWISAYILFFVAFIFLFLPLLVLNYASMRYLLDFMPAIVLAAGIAFGACLSSSQSRMSAFLTLLAGLVTSSCSAITSLLLAITGYYSHFEKLNPSLFDQLVRFFAL